MGEFKFLRLGRTVKGMTLIELLVVCAIIGIILAIAIPNILAARRSANEANARKSMQTLRDAEGEFYEQDLDDNGKRDFTNFINMANNNSLRCPNSGGPIPCDEQNALVDNSFEGAIITDGDPASSASCTDSKAGYCISWTGDSSPLDIAGANYGSTILEGDFGWEASMTSAHKTGIRDFGVWGDGVIRCTVSSANLGSSGEFDASRDDGHGACD